MVWRGVYFLWILLPFWYGCLSAWVFLRPYFKVTGKEKLGTYSEAFIYTAVCFAVAIFLDRMGIMNPVENYLKTRGWEKIEVIRVVLYPAVLVIGAKIQELMYKEDKHKKKTLPKSKWDM